MHRRSFHPKVDPKHRHSSHCHQRRSEEYCGYQVGIHIEPKATLAACVVISFAKQLFKAIDASEPEEVVLTKLSEKQQRLHEEGEVSNRGASNVDIERLYSHTLRQKCSR